MELAYNFSGMTDRQVAENICEGLNLHLGVDLMPILGAAGLDNADKQQAMITMLLEAIFERAHQQGNTELVWQEEGPNTGLQESDIDIEPNMVFIQENADYLKDLQGQDLKDYLFNLTKRFENMAEATSPGVLVAEMAAGGLISVGVPMAVGTVKALRAGNAVLAAMKIGIKSIGMKTAIVAVAVILVALLLYLFLENPKKILGMVVNDTSEDFVVHNWKNDNKGDLFMQHGHMVDFMQDNETDRLDSPKVQLKGKLDFGANDPDNVVFAGIYFADRNFGLLGSEGVMFFSSKESDLKFAHMFAVPYFNDNGTNITKIDSVPSDKSGYFRTLYNSRKVRVDKTEGQYRFTSTVNDPRGGVVGCIASITG